MNKIVVFAWISLGLAALAIMPIPYRGEWRPLFTTAVSSIWPPPGCPPFCPHS
jgi:hypothetical protein